MIFLNHKIWKKNIMKQIKTFLLVLCIFPGIVFARIEANFPNARPAEPQQDTQGNIRQKSVIETHLYSPDIIIRTNNVKLAPTSGSPGQITPVITKRNTTVMNQVSKVYLIWYGNWNGSKSNTPAGQDIIRKLVDGLADNTNSYVQVSTATTGSSIGSYGAYNVQLSSKVISNYYPKVIKTTLSDSDVQSLVKQAIAASTNLGGGGNIPDPNAIYLVLTSSEIAESSGFCSKYCGWHTYTSMTVSNIPQYIKYGFIGNPDRCITSCAVQTSTSPNNLPGADGMVSVIAHEMEEIVTDPLLNNWYNSNGYENADMCAWTFGATTLLPNNSYSNVTLGASNTKFLLQRALGSNSYCYTAAP